MHTIVITELANAYAMELETVQNYLAASVNLDGIRCDVVKRALAADVPEELAHAQILAKRIKTLGGQVPGSLSLLNDQESLQPHGDTTNIIYIIEGVIEAEDAAIAQYKKIIQMCESQDYVTQDMAVTILADEEEHRREFMGFLKEYQKD